MPAAPDGTDSPRATLLIVGVFGVLVIAGWLGLYFGLFVPRVTP